MAKNNISDNSYVHIYDYTDSLLIILYLYKFLI